MTYPISDVERRAQYTGSAGVGPYSFTFEILDQTDIAVYKNSTLLTLTTDYSVTINVDGTGSITLVVAATGSDTITLVGARDISRVTDFVTGGDLLATSLNDELDSQTIFSQQLLETQNRTFRFAPYANVVGISTDLPTPSPNKGLKWNSAGDALEVTTYDLDEFASTASGYASAAAASASAASGFASAASASASAIASGSQTVTNLVCTGGTIDGTTIGDNSRANIRGLAGDFSLGLTVGGAAFNSRGIRDSAVTNALRLSGSEANYVTVANSATNPTIGTSAGNLTLSAGGVQGLLLAPNATADTYAQFTLPASGNNYVALLGQGSGADVGMFIGAKGAGAVGFYTGGLTSLQVAVTHTASATRYLTLTGAAAGGNPKISASSGSLEIPTDTIFGPYPTYGQYSANITSRDAGPSFEWGHWNSGGYGSVLGADAGGGGPYIALSCGPGTTTNTYRTYGKAGSLLTSDAVGGFYFSSIDTATADNQSPSNQVRIIGTSGATRWITLTGSAGGNPTIGTSAGSLNVAPSNGTVQVSGTGNAQLSISAAAASTALHTFSVGGVETARITSADGNNLYLGLGSTSAAQVRIDYTASANRYITLTGSNGGNPTIGTSGGSLAISSALVLSQTTLLSTSVSLTNGAAAAAGTITNAPSAGNPTKWIPINDNGTTRYIPAW